MRISDWSSDVCSSDLTACSVAKKAAMMTKIRMPPMKATIAMIDCRVGLWPDRRALSSVVTTSATAPRGCTRIGGAAERQARWQMLDRDRMTVRATNDGRGSSAALWPRLGTQETGFLEGSRRERIAGEK